MPNVNVVFESPSFESFENTLNARYKKSIYKLKEAERLRWLLAKNIFSDILRTLAHDRTEPLRNITAGKLMEQFTKTFSSLSGIDIKTLGDSDDDSELSSLLQQVFELNGTIKSICLPQIKLVRTRRVTEPVHNKPSPLYPFGDVTDVQTTKTDIEFSVNFPLYKDSYTVKRSRTISTLIANMLNKNVPLSASVENDKLLFLAILASKPLSTKMLIDFSNKIQEVMTERSQSKHQEIKEFNENYYGYSLVTLTEDRVRSQIMSKIGITFPETETSTKAEQCLNNLPFIARKCAGAIAKKYGDKINKLITEVAMEELNKMPAQATQEPTLHTAMEWGTMYPEFTVADINLDHYYCNEEEIIDAPEF